MNGRFASQVYGETPFTLCYNKSEVFVHNMPLTLPAAANGYWVAVLLAPVFAVSACLSVAAGKQVCERGFCLFIYFRLKYMACKRMKSAQFNLSLIFTCPVY